MKKFIRKHNKTFTYRILINQTKEIKISKEIINFFYL